MKFEFLNNVLSGKLESFHDESECQTKFSSVYNPEYVYYHGKINGKCIEFIYKSDIVEKFDLLNAEQKRVFFNIMNYKFNIIQAPAGSGKSFLIKIICDICRDSGIRVTPTSTTNKSSQNINGITIHSFTDIRINTKSTMKIVRDMRDSKIEKINSVELLVIDEISMMSVEFFEKMNNIFKLVRGNNDWFGGVRLMLCGDVLQLPIIRTGNEDIKTVFDSKIWKQVNFKYNDMSIIMRQTDGGFIDALNEIRTHPGYPKPLSHNTMEILKSMIRPHEPADDNIIYISGLNSECEYVNRKLSSKILSENQNFNYVENTYSLKNPEYRRPGKKTVLCVGMKIIFTDTIYSSSNFCIPAGTTGFITDFVSAGLNDHDNNLYSVLRQDRVPYSKSLCVNGINLEEVKVPENTVDWKCFPVVQTADRRVIPTHLYHYKFVYNPISKCNKAIEATVKMPLSIAYAITVHKAQGCTLNRIVLNVYSLFEYQHFYTAISRVRTRDDVFILPGANYDSLVGDISRARKDILSYIHCNVKFANRHILNCLNEFDDGRNYTGYPKSSAKDDIGDTFGSDDAQTQAHDNQTRFD